MLAEAIVLWHMLHRPTLVDSYPEVGTLLWKPEHKSIWEAYRSVPERRLGYFEQAVYRHIREQWPDHAERILSHLDYVVEDWLAWQWQRYEVASQRGEWRFPHEFQRGFDWWFRRLQQCADGRRMVGLAWQQIDAICRVDYYRDEPEADAEQTTRQALAAAVLDLD